MGANNWILDFCDVPFVYKNRLILDTPFSSKSTISYGLIVYAKNTKRWAVIQRKHSVEFLLFIRGLYRATHLPLLLSSVTSDEAKIIKSCLDCGHDFFKVVYLQDLDLNPEDMDYALTRFSESYNDITKLLATVDFSKNNLKWTWPKGRLLISKEKETPFTCAQREFTEEVELDLPCPSFVSDSYISESLKTIAGRTIESRYWIYVIPYEISMNIPNNHPEVSSRKWASTEECLKLMQHNELFKQVVEIVEMQC